MSKAIFTAIVENISTRSDKTLKIILGTNEQTTETKSRLFEMHQNSIMVLFSPNPITTEEAEVIAETQSDFGVKAKSQSQRLRGVIYRYWEQNKKGYEDFELFYRFETERIIEHYKSKLD